MSRLLEKNLQWFHAENAELSSPTTVSYFTKILFFFFLAGSVGTKHGWKLSVSSQEDSVVSCFEMLKHLVEQWSLAQRRSCFSSLYSSGFTRFEQRSLALQLSEVKDSRG